MAGGPQQALPFLSQGDVRLPAVMFHEKLMQVVAGDSFAAEIERSYLHVNATIPKVASGKSCALATTDVIKERCVNADSHFSASGTLSQLNLRVNAISSLDVGTIKMVIEQSTSINRLHELIGPIVINIDACTGAEFLDLVRADKDGYVQALCLIILWCADDANLAAALSSLATDLTFKFQKLGQGLGLLLKCMCMGRSYIHVGDKRSVDRCGDPGSPWHETHKDTHSDSLVLFP